MISKFKNFIQDDIWRIKAKKLPAKKLFPIRILRVFILTLKEFSKDQCQLRASALTFFSLLSIVPVFAMAFGIAKGFGLEKLLQKKILESSEGQQEVFTRIMEFSEKLLQNTQGGIVAGIGVVLLFWTVIKVLGTIEQSFNHIWGVKAERTLGRKFGDYLAMMLICPVLFIISSSLTVFVTSQMSEIIHKISILSAVAPLLLTVLNLVPYCVWWVLLTFIYIFMPNTKVNFPSALIGGVVAGTIYQVVQWFYIHFQIGAANYGAIYGSFAALPLFLVWLQTSWTIVLFGAEIAFAHQNEDTYEFEPDSMKVSLYFKKLIALRMTQLCIKKFCDGQPGLNASQISDELDLPIRLTRQILYDLADVRILAEVKSDSDKNSTYQPARPVDDLTIPVIIDALEKKGADNIPIQDSVELEKLKDRLQSYYENLATPADKLSLKH